MTPALVIFDCDGVLVDSEPVSNRVLAEDLTARGLPMRAEECIDLFAGGTMRGVAKHARARGAELPHDWIDRINDAVCAALADEAVAVPGIHGALDALDRVGRAYCVASNGPMRKMRVTLGRTQIWHRVEGRVYSAYEVGRAKPDPGLFLHAAARLGAEPRACVVIEDSQSGARAARAAGMRCLGYAAATPATRLAGEGAEIFSDMAALPGLLGL